MRALKRNMQKMWYALVESVPIAYERDDDGYIDYMLIDGEYLPKETGNIEPIYTNPVPFGANIHGVIGEAEATRFGISISDYDAYIYAPKGTLPLEEGALIWYEQQPQLNVPADPSTADYIVARVPVVLDESVYLLRRRDHNGQTNNG